MNKKGMFWKRILSCLLGMLMVLPMMIMSGLAATAYADGDYGLSNPTWNSKETISTWDCIYFGNYYQSDSGTKEPIKWRVLNVSGNEAFLLADMNLDSKPYNETDTEVTWESCSLRTWLNNDFLYAAFDPDEQNAILTTELVNEDNPVYDTAGGNDTRDRIFLLSIAEASNQDYGFHPDFYRFAEPSRYARNTAYAEAQGAWTSTIYPENGFWWLRSPGDFGNSASGVTSYGDGFHDGIVNERENAVRPALHLDLSSSAWCYAGTVSSDVENWRINKKQISLSQKTMAYTGRPLEPEVTVSGLTRDVDYRVSYQNNTRVGIASVTISGIGDYKGTVTKKFSIVPKAVSAPKLTNTATGIRIRWGRVSSAGGYKIYRSKNGENYTHVKTIPSNSTVSYLDTKANTNGAQYTYMIKAYKEVYGRRFDADYSPKRVIYRLSRPSITSLSAATKAFTLKWSKNAKATGYQIQYATDSDFTHGKKTVTVSSYKTISKKIRSLKSGQKYYVRVRAFKTINGVRYESAWSARKTVRCK